MIRQRHGTVTAVLLVSATFGSIGCDARAGLQAAATQLAIAADECLYDVRDRQLAWERSSNCASLPGLAASYIALGGFQQEGVDIRIIAEGARTSAWMAKATSLAGGRALSIW